MLSKGGDGMSRPTAFDRVRCPKEVMSCHARRLSTVCVAQRRCWHAMPDVVQPCVLPKRDVGMPSTTSFDRACCINAVMSCHAQCDRVYCPRAVMACHARRCQPCVLPKGDDDNPRPTSFDRVCRPRATMACHARRHPTVCAAQR